MLKGSLNQPPRRRNQRKESMSNISIYQGPANTYWYGPHTSRVEIEAKTVIVDGKQVYAVKVTGQMASKNDPWVHNRFEVELTSDSPSIFDAFPNAKHKSPVNANYTVNLSKETSDV